MTEMPTLLKTGPERSGKTSVAAGLLAWLRCAGRTATYCKPFSADGEADADHAFAFGALADGLDIAVGPAPRPTSPPLDAGFIGLLRSGAETIIVEAAEGSTSSESAVALDARVLEVHSYDAGQDWVAVNGRYASQAVIIRIQRPDIQLACILPQTRCLVLTGLCEPTEYVKPEAWEPDIPLLQVFASTVEIADALDLLFDS